MTYAFIGSFDTRSVGKKERIDFWSERCTADVVGLTCATTEEDGFQAKFEHYDFGSFSVFDIAGEPHLTCRSAEFVRKFEKDSVFISLMVEGTAFVNRRERLDIAKPGDLILYDTNHPYIHGYQTRGRHVVFDMPGQEFRDRFPDWSLADSLRIDGNNGAGVAIARAMRKAHSDVKARKYLAPDPLLVNDIWSALELTHDLVFGQSDVSSYHLGILQRARAFVRARIDDPDLDTTAVAAEVGISARQLNRILAGQDMSVKKMILSERLDLARRMIADAGGARANLTEIAYACGFSGPSQFSKCFRRRYGVAPSSIRREEGPGRVDLH